MVTVVESKCTLGLRYKEISLALSRFCWDTVMSGVNDNTKMFLLCLYNTHLAVSLKKRMFLSIITNTFMRKYKIGILRKNLKEFVHRNWKHTFKATNTCHFFYFTNSQSFFNLHKGDITVVIFSFLEAEMLFLELNMFSKDECTYSC